MFNSLTGTVTGRSPGSLYVTVGGVEWDLDVSALTLRELSTATGEVVIYTYLYHREDQMRLFGFSTTSERQVFLELIKVSGVGPKAAIKLLSAASPAEIIRALEAEDVAALSRLPGVGKKTAQKIILSLRGSLAVEPGESGGRAQELVASLVEMGFEKAAAARTVSRLLLESETQPTEQEESEIMRRAIVALSAE